MGILVFLVLWIVLWVMLTKSFKRWAFSEPYMFDLPLPLWLSAIISLAAAVLAGAVAVLIP